MEFIKNILVFQKFPKSTMPANHATSYWDWHISCFHTDNDFWPQLAAIMDFEVFFLCKDFF